MKLLSPATSRTLVLFALLLATPVADAGRRMPPRQIKQHKQQIQQIQQMQQMQRAVQAEADSKAQLLAALQAQVAELQRRLAILEESAAQRTARPGPGVISEAAASGAVTAPSRRLPPASVATSAQAAAASQPANEDLSRALERALVREGGLVLPPGVIELEPRFRYQHRSTHRLELVSIAGQPQVAQVDRKLDASQLSLGLRMGLPWSSQLELMLPYASNRQRTVAAGSFSSVDSASGFGNAEIGVTKQLFAEPGGFGFLASLRWIGQADANADATVAAGSSFSAVQGGLLFVTRRDPVVYFGALSHSLSQRRRIAGALIDPGDATGLRTGAIVALSPDTSLRLGLDVSRTGDARLDSTVVAGSGKVQGEFSTGFSFVLTPRVLLGVEAGMGLTPASPDFRVGLSLPFRF